MSLSIKAEIRKCARIRTLSLRCIRSCAERSAFHGGTGAKPKNGDNLSGANRLSTGISCAAPGYPPRFGSVVHRITALIVCEQLATLKMPSTFIRIRHGKRRDQPHTIQSDRQPCARLRHTRQQRQRHQGQTWNQQIGQHVPALPSQQRLSHHAAGNQRTADAERCATQRECMPMPNAAFTMSDAEMRHRLSNCVDIL